MNGLPHWEQQELFLVLVSIMGLVVVVVVCVCVYRVGRRGGYLKANQGQIERVEPFERVGWIEKVEVKTLKRKGRRRGRGVTLIILSHGKKRKRGGVGDQGQSV